MLGMRTGRGLQSSRTSSPPGSPSPRVISRRAPRQAMDAAGRMGAVSDVLPEARARPPDRPPTREGAPLPASEEMMTPGRRSLRFHSFDEIVPDVERLVDGHSTVG